MQLEERIASLIAVGASVAANCQPCFDVNARKALKAGAEQGQIVEAIAIGKLVRKGVASSMDAFLSGMEASVIPEDAEGISCACANTRRTS